MHLLLAMWGLFLGSEGILALKACFRVQTRCFVSASCRRSWETWWNVMWLPWSEMPRQRKAWRKRISRCAAPFELTMKTAKLLLFITKHLLQCSLRKYMLNVNLVNLYSVYKTSRHFIHCLLKFWLFLKDNTTAIKETNALQRCQFSKKFLQKNNLICAGTNNRD